ncbi:MAG: hypothetical protein ACRC1E_14090 [Craterilacuibacter sp.]
MREPVGSRQVYKGEIEEKLSRNIAASQQGMIISIGYFIVNDYCSKKIKM